MSRWVLQLLIALAVLAQGGALRACDVKQFLLGGDDDARAALVPADTCPDPTIDQRCMTGWESTGGTIPCDGSSQPCMCGFHKGMEKPDYLGDQVHPLAGFAVDFSTAAADFMAIRRAPARLPSIYPPAPSGRSLPLLI